MFMLLGMMLVMVFAHFLVCLKMLSHPFFMPGMAFLPPMLLLFPGGFALFTHGLVVLL